MPTPSPRRALPSPSSTSPRSFNPTAIPPPPPLHAMDNATLQAMLDAQMAELNAYRTAFKDVIRECRAVGVNVGRGARGGIGIEASPPSGLMNGGSSMDDSFLMCDDGDDAEGRQLIAVYDDHEEEGSLHKSHGGAASPSYATPIRQVGDHHDNNNHHHHHHPHNLYNASPANAHPPSHPSLLPLSPPVASAPRDVVAAAVHAYEAKAVGLAGTLARLEEAYQSNVLAAERDQRRVCEGLAKEARVAREQLKKMRRRVAELTDQAFRGAEKALIKEGNVFSFSPHHHSHDHSSQLLQERDAHSIAADAIRARIAPVTKVVAISRLQSLIAREEAMAEELEAELQSLDLPAAERRNPKARDEAGGTKASDLMNASQQTQSKQRMLQTEARKQFKREQLESLLSQQRALKRDVASLKEEAIINGCVAEELKLKLIDVFAQLGVMMGEAHGLDKRKELSRNRFLTRTRFT